MTNRLLLSCLIFPLLAGCDYGVKVDSEGGVDVKMPGQSIKTSKDGVEIDQGVQKMKVGKGEVDIEQPGQRVRIVDGNVEINQGIQKMRIGKDDVDIQQPNQQLRVSNERVEIELNSSAADASTPEVSESNPFVEVGKTETVEEESNANDKNEATQNDKVDKSPSIDVEPKAKESAERPMRPVPAARVAVQRSPLRLRRTAPQGQKDFSGQSLIQINLSGRDLRGADFSNAKITQCDFQGCDLAGANFDGAVIGQCSFEDANLHNATFEKAAMTQGWFSGADFSGASFRGADLTQTDFRASTLTMADFAEAQERSVKKP